ncbi:pectinesterase family protein [Arabidopsis lyrata subsp. lyrata]|uniref:pectinesterase n=2 Tax=Arabidopsis lyrata subsp. lyrata TaxID=81972 RepID=D7LBW7_ARALL|nr:pectinesterase family protein [Arabidopsis lyrata subsp. lyrata]
MGLYKTKSKRSIANYYHIILINIFILSSITFSSMASSNSSSSSIDFSTAILIRVDQSGKGDFSKIQEAIESIPPNLNNSQLYYIWVKPGIYREKVVIPADKPYITLSGTQASNTFLIWSDGGDILESPTLTIFATDFVCRFLTIQNKLGTAGRAVALRVAADKAAFYGCVITSYQDTLLDDNGNHYFKNCYIEGATDFICGSASSLYERCHLHSLSPTKGSITAQMRTSATEKSGFIFLGCKLTGSSSTYLGRPWGPYSRVIFAYSFFSNVVAPRGWNQWGDSTKENTVYYGEYKCYGPGADRGQRVKWSKQLSDDEATVFLSKDFIGGKDWLRPAPSHFKKWSQINPKIYK